MALIEDLTPEEMNVADTIGDRVSAAADTRGELPVSSQAKVLSALSKDPPTTAGLEDDPAALRQANEEISIRKAKIDFMNSLGFDIDSTESFDVMFKDKDGNVNTKNVQKTQELLEFLEDQKTKDPSFLDKLKKKFNDKAQKDPKNATKYGNWAGAITALAGVASALIAFLKNKTDLDALLNALKDLAKGMSGCFLLNYTQNSKHHLSCHEDDANLPKLQAACNNTSYGDLKGVCDDTLLGSATPPTYSFVYQTYTVGDLFADVISAAASIPKDISNAVAWLWDKKWYIVAVFVAILIAIVGFGLAKRYALSNASPPT